MIKNPDPYLIQNKDLTEALVMNNASFSWDSSAPKSPESPGSAANGVKKGEAASPVEVAQNDTHTKNARPTLKNITFTLPKVSVCMV